MTNYGYIIARLPCYHTRYLDTETYIIIRQKQVLVKLELLGLDNENTRICDPAHAKLNCSLVRVVSIRSLQNNYRSYVRAVSLKGDIKYRRGQLLGSTILASKFDGTQTYGIHYFKTRTAAREHFLFKDCGAQLDSSCLCDVLI